jgi:CHAD domain-containing protein
VPRCSPHRTNPSRTTHDRELRRRRITRGYRTIVKRGSAITPASPAEELHRLRKRCKQLRYLMEYFASLHNPTAHRKMIKN